MLFPHNIASVTFAEAEPAEGYGPDARVAITFTDGRAPVVGPYWGSDAAAANVRAWRTENGDAAVAPYVAPAPTVPDRVGRRQFMLQLAISGYKTSVEAWVATQDELTQIAYAESGTFVRSEPMLQAGFTSLGFSEGDVDAFYTAAAAL